MTATTEEFQLPQDFLCLPICPSNLRLWKWPTVLFISQWEKPSLRLLPKSMVCSGFRSGIWMGLWGYVCIRPSQRTSPRLKAIPIPDFINNIIKILVLTTSCLLNTQERNSQNYGGKGRGDRIKQDQLWCRYGFKFFLWHSLAVWPLHNHSVSQESHFPYLSLIRSHLEGGFL